MASYACRLFFGLLLLVIAQAARPVFESLNPFDSQPSFRQLQQAQQQQQALNCTPSHPTSATKLPFCFQPDTVSTEARQFLAQAAAGATPLGSSASSDASAAAAAGIQTARDFYRDLNAPLHAAAVQQHLQSVRNSTVGNISVVIGVPKGVSETDPANTKVVIYMHGERLTGCALHRQPGDFGRAIWPNALHRNDCSMRMCHSGTSRAS